MNQHQFKPYLIELLRQSQQRQNVFFGSLSAHELEKIGEPKFWAAKDHVAHLSFWRKKLVLKLEAHFQQQPQPESLNFEVVNPLVFEENRYRAWSDILAESDQAYAELITLTEKLTEEEITESEQIAWLPKKVPLCMFYMGNCCEHTQIHMSYYLTERNDLPGAMESYEGWVEIMLVPAVPVRLQAHVLYNQACFYAVQGKLELARPTLERALGLDGELRKIAVDDPELVELNK